MLPQLRETGLKLSPAKCVFAAQEVCYLGYCVTHAGLLPDPDLLQAIRETPTPKSSTEVRSFPGLARYYHRFVKGFAHIVAPLQALTRKKVTFWWDSKCQHAFETLKRALTSSPVTAFPDFTVPFCR